jgi:hypothetical protein
MLLNPKLSADEKVEKLAGLLSHLKGRPVVNSGELEFKAAVDRFKGGPGGGGNTGGPSLNLNSDSGARFKKGGAVKSSKASSRADGCAKRGKTKGRMV